MNITIKEYEKGCLFFTSNTLARLINELAEIEFKEVKLSPAYAHLLILIGEKEGLSQVELCRYISIKPSTMTRFIEKLVNEGLVEKEIKGRRVLIYLTSEGESVKTKAQEALHALYTRYCTILGEKAAIQLTESIYQANEKLKNNDNF